MEKTKTGARVVDLGTYQVTALLHSFAKRRIEKLKHFIPRRGSNPPDCPFLFEDQ